MGVIEDRLSIPEAARLLNVSERSIHNWIDRGELQAEEEYHGKQRRRYVSRAEVLRRQAQPTADPQA